tara:strand:+ start:318 stop:503 length:186 start_codon:yes stop_codon:yes gene_type:complete
MKILVWSRVKKDIEKIIIKEVKNFLSLIALLPKITIHNHINSEMNPASVLVNIVWKTLSSS